MSVMPSPYTHSSSFSTIGSGACTGKYSSSHSEASSLERLRPAVDKGAEVGVSHELVGGDELACLGKGEVNVGRLKEG